MNKQIAHLLTIQFDESIESKTFLYFKDECDLYESIVEMAKHFLKMKYKKKEGKKNAVEKFISQIEDIKILDYKDKDNIYMEKSKEEIIDAIKDYVHKNYE